MAGRSYWLNLFSWETWQEFLKNGGNVSGFREARWTTAKKIKKGDIFLCYLTGISRFIGLTEVVSEVYKSDSKIWDGEEFPCRFDVKIIVSLDLEAAVPIHSMKDKLSIFQNMKSPNAWTGRLRGSPAKWLKKDGEIISAALKEAVKSPVIRPVDKAKLKRRPKGVESKSGLVSLPGFDGEVAEEKQLKSKQQESDHTKVQYSLLKLGNDMGLNVWVAKNDKGRSWNKRPFSSFSNLLSKLPLQFDDATNKTIEMIDVLWLDGNSIVAAFEIESTTSIYSGLLRMADLISMQPNLNIPLFIVAPDVRRNKVITEINRPIFSRLNPPMFEVCRYISFSSLNDGMKKVASIIQYVKSDYLDELAESCELGV